MGDNYTFFIFLKKAIHSSNRLLRLVFYIIYWFQNINLEQKY
jgi:hypothetical protein